ncbi:MAG: nitroreductase family protein [Pseudomonadales bacterium]|jgi:nitroreductase|nr:nitroreductase family protein [Pseudomonadales bacterium]
MSTAATIQDIKTPDTTVPVHRLIAERFSPYGWSDRSVAPEDLAALFEAARWAPSCYNEQPFRYLVATREDPEAFERMLGTLVDGNRAWAQAVPVLALGIVATRFARNGDENAHARHDLGLASANLSLEATARGIAVHQMAGILPDEARTRFGIPEGYEAVTALAIGYADPASQLERDRAPRVRRPLGETVFTGQWAHRASFLG